MKVLAVETSTLMGSVAVLDEERPLCELTLHVRETHSAALMPAIDYVLGTVGVTPNEVDAYAVALGPGSFTGLRIGMAAVKGLAVAAAKPIVGVSTLEAMAREHPFCPFMICPMIDARMKEVYAAWFGAENGKIARHSEDMAVPIAELLKDKDEETLFLGSGVRKYRAEILDMMGDRARFAYPEIAGARAALVGLIGVEKLRNGEVDDMDSLEPRYIRESQAIAKKKRPDVS